MTNPDSFRRPPVRTLALALVAATIVLIGCGGQEGASSSPPADGDDGDGDPGIRVIAPEDAADVLADGDDVVVIDVRTDEEFAAGHLEGATQIDFHRDDFATALSELDRSQPYVIYCRSGNRSGEARAIMADLGFTDVADIDGGILAWEAGGLPVVD